MDPVENHGSSWFQINEVVSKGRNVIMISSDLLIGTLHCAIQIIVTGKSPSILKDKLQDICKISKKNPLKMNIQQVSKGYSSAGPTM